MDDCREHASETEEEVAALYQDVREALHECREATLRKGEERLAAYRQARAGLDERLAAWDRAVERLSGASGVRKA